MSDDFSRDMGEPYIYFQKGSLAPGLLLVNIWFGTERKAAKGISSLAIVEARANTLANLLPRLPPRLHFCLGLPSCSSRVCPGRNFSKLIALWCISLPRCLSTLSFFKEELTESLTKAALQSIVALFVFSFSFVHREQPIQ